MSQWAHYSTPDPDWNEKLAKLDLKAVFGIGGTPNVQELRARMDKLAAAALAKTEYPKTGLIINERSIPVNGGEVEIRTYIPDSGSEAETFPVLATFHGGGYCFGNLDTDEIKCRKACVKHNLAVVNVNYRHAPEHPFPTGLNDSYDSLKWIAQNANTFRGDISKGFIVCGLSAGSKFVCVMTQRARSDDLLKGKITGQILQYPSTLGYIREGEVLPEKYASQLASLEQNKSDAVLNKKAREMMTVAYNPPPLGHLDNTPLFAESFEGLPPAYAQIAGGDVLRDEALLYVKFLEDSGVPTKFDVYPGVPHGFDVIIPEANASKKFQEDFDTGLRWLLSLSKN